MIPAAAQLTVKVSSGNTRESTRFFSLLVDGVPGRCERNLPMHLLILP